MRTRSSKFKVQSSRKASETRGQTACRVELRTGLEESEAFGTLILKEGLVEPGNGKPWELLDRTAVFGEQIVRFAKRILRGPTTDRLIDQLVGAGTSVGANYCEANEAVSRKDFKYSVSRCVKEAKETKFFLRMVIAAEPQLAGEARPLYREARELLCIFAAIYKR
jgi:four helix bundle protein